MNTSAKWTDKGLLIKGVPTVGQVHVGTKLYPLANAKAIEAWGPGSGAQYVNEELSAAIEQNRAWFSPGRCYTTATALQQVGQGLGLPIEFWSGWVLCPTPVHHAWNVLRVPDPVGGEDHVYFFDLTMVLPYIAWTHDMGSAHFGEANPEWRKEAARKAVEAEALPVWENRITGLIPDSANMIYVGSPDTPNDARARFRQLMRDFPKHPAYSIPGMSGGQGESSALQVEVDRLKGVRS